jgi:DNA-3-methyladenine glycosylase I
MNDVQDRQRCPWAGTDPLYISYHDQQWGVPVHDDQLLFEMLLLEGAQAGLSWLTILRKRENYRHAFGGYNVEAIAGYDDTDRTRLLADAGIVRNRLKIDSAIRNAQAALRIRQEHGSLDRFLWDFVDGQPVVNAWRTMADVPALTPTSDRMSKALKQYGCNFVGSTICYAFMQATGMVNDHLLSCFCHPDHPMG